MESLGHLQSSLAGPTASHHRPLQEMSLLALLVWPWRRMSRVVVVPVGVSVASIKEVIRFVLLAASLHLPLLFASLPGPLRAVSPP